MRNHAKEKGIFLASSPYETHKLGKEEKETKTKLISVLGQSTMLDSAQHLHGLSEFAQQPLKSGLLTLFYRGGN